MSLLFLQDSLKNPNVLAFQHMIRISECGTDDCYSFLFGSSVHNNLRFTSFAKHPNTEETFNGYSSTAAGAYQLLYKSWVAIQEKYNLPDFSPHSQDIACAELISERNVLQHTMNGDFDIALRACSNIWASLFYAPYGQPVHPLNQYAIWYTDAGGTIASL